MEDRVKELAEQFVGLVCRPAMFRDSGKAGMMFLFLCGDDMTEPLKALWVSEIVTRFDAHEHVQQRNIGHGLSESRKFLARRDPSARTAAAVSLWEQLVTRLPQDFQYLAREGETE